MEEEEWIYAWEESIFDEDGQLWVVTMLSLLMLPIYQEMKIQAILFESLRTYLKNPKASEVLHKTIKSSNLLDSDNQILSLFAQRENGLFDNGVPSRDLPGASSGT